MVPGKEKTVEQQIPVPVFRVCYCDDSCSNSYKPVSI